MNKIKYLSAISFLLWFVFLGANQKIYAQEDPLIPQSFAFDKAENIFAGICDINNTIDIISYTNGTLNLKTTFNVDNVSGRHDFQHIYRPKSVAIYDGYVVFLASHIDSCYLAVLNTEGKLIKKLYFSGRASAFSFNAPAKELYIAGGNDVGYNIAILGTENGFENIYADVQKSMHYEKPKKADEMFKNDPTGSALALIAMSVVFSVLLVLFICFKFIGNTMILSQTNRAKKAIAKKEQENISVQDHVMPKDISADVYAAIATAIYLYNDELHDEESGVLTIVENTRPYSAWTAKSNGHNNILNIRRK